MNILNTITNALDRLSGEPASPQNAAKVSVEGPQSKGMSSFRGVTQSGTLDGLAQSDPLSARARAELTPIVRPALPKGLLDGVPWPSVSQTQAFDEDMTSEGYQRPRAAFEALKRLDEPFLRLQDAIAQVTRSQHPAFLKNLEDIARRTAEGDPSVHAQDAWTRDDFEEDARQRLDAFKAELRKIQAQAWQIAEPALLEKSAFASSRADELEETAQLPFAKFATAYTPPMYILSLRKYAVSLANGSRRNAGLPSSMLETL